MVFIPKVEPEHEIHAPWWPPEATVTIRGRLSGYHATRIQGGGVALVPDATVPGGWRGQTQPERSALAKLEVGILRWTLCDEEGEPLPCTRDSFERLDAADVDYIAGELTRVWAAWDAEVQKRMEAQRRANEAAAAGESESEKPAESTPARHARKGA